MARRGVVRGAVYMEQLSQNEEIAQPITVHVPNQSAIIG
jgi:hypothetical protein